MNKLDINIIDFIPVGSQNAITRAKLCELTGCGDRVVRQMIAKARENTCICNAQDNKGYYIPDALSETGLAEARAFLKQESARAKSVFRALKGTRKFIQDVENNQMYPNQFI